MSLATVARIFALVPLDLIDEPVLPSRSVMDEQKLDELRDSIRAIGVIQPIALARHAARFEVIAGHRRTVAAKRAGLLEVPALVYPSREAALEAVKFAENHFREDLNAADEAIYLSELLERDCGGDVDRLCAQVQKGRNYVEGRLLLFQGDPVVFDALQNNKISIGVAQHVNKCDNEKYRRMLLHQAIAGGATVAVVRSWIQQWQLDQAHIGDALNQPTPEPVTGATPTYNFFVCAICGKDHNVHTMVQVNMHHSCKEAIFEPMMATARGEA